MIDDEIFLDYQIPIEFQSDNLKRKFKPVSETC